MGVQVLPHAPDTSRTPFVRLLPYGIALAFTAVAFLARRALDSVVGDAVPFAMFYLAALASAWFGGFYPGLCAVTAGYVLADWFFLVPRGALSVLDPSVPQLVAASAYVTVGVAACALVSRSRRLRESADRNTGAARLRREEIEPLTLAQDELRASEARLRAVVANASDGVVTIDERQCITFFNEAAEQIFRCSREAAIGTSLERFIPAELRETHAAHVRSFVAAGTTARRMGGPGRVLPALRADGDEFLMEAQISQTVVAGEKLLTVILRDVTERCKAEEELRSRAAQQAAVAELGEVALAASDIDGFLDSVVAVVTRTLELEFAAVWEFVPTSNDFALRAGVGWNRGLVGHAVLPGGLNSLAGYTLYAGATDVVTVEELATETRFSIPALLRSHAIVSGCSVVIHGESRPFGILSAYAGKRRAFSAQDSSFLQTVANLIAAALLRSSAIAREREARTQAEAANQAKDLFLATVSHELRTPLSPILAWSSMLKENRLDEAQRHRAVEVIERSARSQAQIIDDLLDVSRIVSGRMRLQVRAVKLAEVVDAAVEAVRPAAEAKSVHLHTVVDPDAGPVSGDPTRLQQVVWNLVSNAVKFTSRDGRVQVRVERVESHVEIVVADTGQGIAPEVLPHIFENFWQADASSTRRHGGLGLGLGIVRRIVELHGGTVFAASPGLGEGSVFTVNLPLMALRRETHEPEARRHPAVKGSHTGPCPPGVDLTNLRVLVVDDEPASNEVVAMLLATCGAEVRVAASAAQARAVLEHWPVDVLISDIGMPGEDGYALIRSLRASGGATAEVPAIALTAFVSVEDRVKVLSSGFQMHVPKPVDASELLAVVANLARRSGKIPPIASDEPTSSY